MDHISAGRSRQAISRGLFVILGLFLPFNLPHASLLLLAQDAAQHRSGDADEKDIQGLEASRTVKRELAGGQQHTYQIKLSAGQFLKAVVEQEGIDLLVEVSGPDGNRLLEFDAEIRRLGGEEVPLVAESTGEYRLTVRSSQKGAAAGSYEIRIEELREATDRDRALQEARKLEGESDKLESEGKYDQALPLAERVLEIRERTLGAEAPDVADALNNLALLYYHKGDYARAEPLYQRALAIWEKALGPDHSDVAFALNNLALLYYHKGDYARAEPLYQRALAIWEKVLGPNHSNVALALNNLAGLYYDRGEYVKVEPLYQRALAIREKALGLVHPDVAISLNNLAFLYYNRGEYAKAEPLHRRALAISEKALGPDHPDVSHSLNNLANLYREQSEYAKAEPLYGRALDIRERALGSQHPLVTKTLDNLARFYAAKGDPAQAIVFQSRANDVGEHNIALNLANGSERQKLAYLALFSAQTDFALTLHSQAAPDDALALDLAFTTLLHRKGRALDTMTDTIAALRRRLTPEDQKLFDQLAETRSQLAALTFRESSATPDTYQRRLKPLEEKIESLEAELSSHSIGFRTNSQPVTLSSVQAALPAGSALIEFTIFTPRDLQTGKNKPPRYLAYLLPAQGRSKWVDLGEAAPIDQAIDEWREALRGRPDVKQLGRELDEKVMRPVRSLLGATRRLLIAPDGSLNLIPFAALVDENDRYLVERYTISYLTSGRDLLRLHTSEPRQNQPLIVANPDFGRVANATSRAAQSGGADPASISFRPLPGTQGEALGIKAVMPEASMHLRSQATEAALKQAHSPRILHIATHGFFLSDEGAAPAEVPGTFGGDSLRLSDLRLGKWVAHIKDPLLRSGLALSGANLGKSGDDDGVLTALEVAGLDLLGTKLVVLSACETGVGEIRNGEGVHGLRRALVLAGSESQIMSLWPVEDKGAKELMIQYYRALRRGEERSEGLRQVQLRMLQSTRWWHPFHWAAFIQSGAWTNLKDNQPSIPR
jgi:CHAT domain-containing protein/Tfp pilus assembly protein PilF